MTLEQHPYKPCERPCGLREPHGPHTLCNVGARLILLCATNNNNDKDNDNDRDMV